jgi:hypothetical protein
MQPGAGERIQSGAAGRAQRRYEDEGERVVQFVREAYERSDAELMLNFYRANYPKEPYVELADWAQVDVPVTSRPGALLAPKRVDRVHSAGAARREIRGENRRRPEDERHGDERRDVEGVDTEQQTAE